MLHELIDKLDPRRATIVQDLHQAKKTIASEEQRNIWTKSHGNILSYTRFECCACLAAMSDASV